MKSKDLKKWRKQNDYSQSELAHVLGIATMTISRWETGVRAIPPYLTLALAEVVRQTKRRTK